jgi:hypothetical protein
VIELALVEAQLGDTRGAAERIEDFLAELGERGGPVTRGSLHEARVRIALLNGDEAAAERHLAHVERWFRPTHNPALVARCERLRRELGVEPGPRAVSSSDTLELGLSAVERVHRALRECTDSAQRFACALDLLLEHTGGSGGAIFACAQPDERALRAQRGEIEVEQASQLVEAQLYEHSDGGDGDVTVSSDTGRSSRRCEPRSARGRSARLRVLLLAVEDSAGEHVVAGAVIAAGTTGLRLPPQAVLTALAEALREDEEAASGDIA